MVKISTKNTKRKSRLIVGGIFLCTLIIVSLSLTSSVEIYTKDGFSQSGSTENATSTTLATTNKSQAKPIATIKMVESAPVTAAPMLIIPMTPVDPAIYDAKMLKIANLPPLPVTASTTATSTVVRKPSPWPVKGAPYPNAGALLPSNRIIAYYGNLYSRRMGVLGKYDPPEMLAMLASTTKKWHDTDPSTPIIPALDYIAVVAQAGAGVDGKHRARMPDSEIDKVIALAAQINAIVILDVQVGLSNVQSEIPYFEKYLKLPQVHLALDPEFSMHNGARPGTVVGTMDAVDVNFTANYLAKLVKENNLPPKVLIVHRFTRAMLTNAKKIKPLPDVQVVIDMDGFGSSAKKIGTYTQVVIPEPVQFTGFKLFYVNDVAAGHMMTPSEVLKLSPQPSFIQYQ